MRPYPGSPATETCRAFAAASTVSRTGITSARWTRAITRAAGLEPATARQGSAPRAGEPGEREQRVKTRAVDEGHPVEVDHEPADRQRIELGTRCVHPELVQLALEPHHPDAVDLVSAQLDVLHDPVPAPSSAGAP